MGRELILVLGPCWSKLWPGADCGPGANFSAGGRLEQILDREQILGREQILVFGRYATRSQSRAQINTKVVGIDVTP